MNKNETFIELLKNIENDEIFDDLQRGMIRSAIRCTEKFMLFEYLNGNSIVKAAIEIEKMFPDEFEK